MPSEDRQRCRDRRRHLPTVLSISQWMLLDVVEECFWTASVPPKCSKHEHTTLLKRSCRVDGSVITVSNDTVWLLVLNQWLYKAMHILPGRCRIPLINGKVHAVPGSTFMQAKRLHVVFQRFNIVLVTPSEHIERCAHSIEFVTHQVTNFGWERTHPWPSREKLSRLSDTLPTCPGGSLHLWGGPQTSIA